MQTKSPLLTSLVKIVSCAILLLGVCAQAEDKKPDPSGTWMWTMPGRNGGPDRTNTLTLAVADNKLTGTLSRPGRDGQAIQTPIADGKVAGDAVSFTVVRQFNGNSMTNNYSGKIADDKITGKVEFMRDDERQSRDWEAKRSVETK